MSLVQHLAVVIGVLVSKMEESIEARIQASLKTTQDPDGRSFPAYPGGKSWDDVPGKTGSGKKFYRNVISGADFTADVRLVPGELEVIAREWESFNAEAAHDPELACMHRYGHCRKAVMWYVHHLPEWTKEVIRDRASLPPRRFATISRWRNNMPCAQRAFEEKVTLRKLTLCRVPNHSF